MSMIDFQETPGQPDVIAPSGLLEIIRNLPGFKEREMEVIREQINDIKEREVLAGQITEYIRERYRSHAPENSQAMQANVFEQLGDLDNILTVEKEEAVRKAEKFAEIEADPEKKGLLATAMRSVKEGWEKIKKHKWKILIALTAIAGGFLVWYYWEYLSTLFASLGITGQAAETGAAVTQEEAVATAVEGVEAAAALNNPSISLVEHSFFLDGVEYLSTDPVQMEKLKGVLQAMAEGKPDFLLHLQQHETARMSSEVALQDMMQAITNRPDALHITDIAEILPQ